MRVMNIKYLLSAVLAIAISTSAFAQTNNAGIDYFKLGEIKLAKEVLTNHVNQSPGESYYYLGEIAFLEGNLAEAKANYEKGFAADPEGALNQIGLAKVELKSNPKEASKTLSSIQKKYKKDVKIILEIAQAFADNGMQEDAMSKLADARKVDRKSPWIYVCEGDIYAKANKPGDAAAQYDQAINFDADCAIAYVKNARVYEGINAQTAVSMLKKAIEIRPNYTITYKYLGDLNYQYGHYKDAIDAYSKYFAKGDYAVNDITRYAGAQYFTQNFDEAKRLLNDGLKREPNNFVLYRLLMYSQNEAKDYEAGLVSGKKFFNIVRQDTAKYIVQDFTSYANILKETGNLDEAIVQYGKAIELDATKISIYKDIASTLAGEDKTADAAKIYQKYIDAAGDAIDASDFFQVGRYYFMAAQASSKSANEAEKANTEGYLKEADAAFATVAERMPDSYLGNFWRARTASLLDPETKLGLAKPYYEAAIATILAKEDHSNNKELIEAYTYLGVYNYYHWVETSKSTKTASDAKEAREYLKIYTDKLLELDPANATGLQFKDVLNQ